MNLEGFFYLENLKIVDIKLKGPKLCVNSTILIEIPICEREKIKMQIKQ